MSAEDNEIYIGSQSDNAEQKLSLLLKYANRHGLIAGATGTGKTVTLQGLAESFSCSGVPVFMADVKGDLSGMAEASEMQDFLLKRADIIGFSDQFKAQAMPVTLWDIYGEKGIPLRTTISEMGPILLAQVLDLNDTQEGVLNIAFRIADEEGLALLDMKDLRAMLISMGERAKELSIEYGNISTATIGAIQRKLLQVEGQGGDLFFGETALDIEDFLRCDENGKGMINILAADKLSANPKLYSTFLLWLISELFEELPEAGDQDKPKLVFFFDEAHLLFDNAPKALLDRIEQVVKLIRSKGVGIYFVTQNPADIPESVLGQLGNRIQHALRAFTAKQRKSIKLAAQTYRENPSFSVETAITELGVGEALVSTLEKKGQPSIVERTLIRPPYSKLGPASAATTKKLIEQGEMAEKYGMIKDRKSAYEILAKRTEKKAKAQEEKEPEKAKKAKKRKSSRQGAGETFVKSVLRQVGAQLARQIGKALLRGIMGALKR